MASITSQWKNSLGRPIASATERLITGRPLLILSALAGASALIYGFAFVRIANLFEFYRTPRVTLYKLLNGDKTGLQPLILAFAALALIYWLGWRISRNLQGKAAWLVVIAGSLISGAILLLIYPFDATDVFDNILRGRIAGIYGANPFLAWGNRYANDPFYSYIGWRGWPSAYGPGWELTSSLVARLAGNDVIANVLAYKVLPGLFLLASLVVVALLLRAYAPRQALAGTLLLAWNPIVLYETWGNGHNDMAMVFWMLLAALAVFKRRYTAAILALVAGALFKFIPVLLIPAVVVLGWRAQPTIRRQIIFVAKAGFLSILLAAVFYAPFWEGVKVLNIQSRENLYTSSLPSVVFNLLLTRSLPRQATASLVSHAALALLLLFVLWRCWRVWKSPTFAEYVNSSALILLFYLMFCCLWFQNWYSLWPIGLLPLLKPGPTWSIVALFGFLTLSKQLGIGPVLFWPRPELEQPWLEVWLTLGVLGLPWLSTLGHLRKIEHENASV